MITTTLKALRKAGACAYGYNKLVRSLQGIEFSESDKKRKMYIRLRHESPIDLAYIAESNDIDDAVWALRASDASDRDMRLFAVWCARQVQHLMTDHRSIDAIDTAERFANGNATKQDMAAAWAAAGSAAQDAARAAAWAAARDAELHKQKLMFIAMCNGDAPWQK